MAKQGETVTKIIKLVQYKEKLNTLDERTAGHIYFTALGAVAVMLGFGHGLLLDKIEEGLKQIELVGDFTKYRLPYIYAELMGGVFSVVGLIGLIKDGLNKTKIKTKIEFLEADLGPALVNRVNTTIKTSTEAIYRKGK